MPEMEDFLKALADENRLKIIDFVKRGARTSIEIQEALKKSQSTISQHLKILVDEEILTYERDLAKKIYSIKYTEVIDIISSINQLLARRNQEKLTKISEEAVSDTLRT